MSSYRRPSLAICRSETHNEDAEALRHTRGALAAVLAMHCGREVTVSNALLQRARNGEIAIRTRVEDDKTVMWAEKANADQ